MKAIFFILLISAFWLNPVAATGLPPGFAEEDDEGATPSVQRAEVDYQRLLLQAMLEQVEEKEILQLELDEERQFIALAKEALSDQPKGRVLLLPADGHHPNWPEGLASLRTQLADYGWHTLALSLPVYQPLGPPQRTLPPGPLLSRLGSSAATPAENDEDPDQAGFAGGFDEPEADPASEEPVSQDPAERLAQQQDEVVARLQVALNHFPDQGRQVLVLQGEAVFWLLPWLAAQADRQPLALVLLHVQVPAGAQADDLNALLRSLENWPLLDIYTASDRQQARLAEQRQAAYRRSGNNKALQLNMERAPGQSLGNRERWLNQRVEGWLRSL